MSEEIEEIPRKRKRYGWNPDALKFEQCETPNCTAHSVHVYRKKRRSRDHGQSHRPWGARFLEGIEQDGASEDIGGHMSIEV